MNSSTCDERGREFAETVGKALAATPQNDRAVDIKKALNELLWRHVKPTTTIEQADKAACAAFDAIWPLCPEEY